MNKKTKLISMMVFILLVISMGGCASKSIAVNKSISQLTADKSKAYIIFIRTLPGLPKADIMHFDNVTYKTKYVASLSNGERVVYPVNVGSNYFYINSNNIININTKAGLVYYVIIDRTSDIGFFPKLYKKSRFELGEYFKTQKCSPEFLNRFLFIKEDNGYEDSSYELEDNHLKYLSKTHFKIKCTDQKITDVEDIYFNYTLAQLNKTSLIKPTNKGFEYFKDEQEDYEEDIKELYPIWNLKFRDSPYTNDPFLEIKKMTSLKHLHKYSNVKIKTANTDYKDNNASVDFKTSLIDEFKEYKQGKELTLEYKINVLDLGNDAAKILSSSFSQSVSKSNYGVIDIDVLFKDNGKIIGKIRITQIDGIGGGGGLYSITTNIIDIIYQYTLGNFIKIKE